MVIDQSIPFHKPKKKIKSEEWEENIDNLIPQTKPTISECDMVLGAFLKNYYTH